MEGYTIIVLIFGFIILISLVVLFFVNRLISYKRRVQNSLFAVLECLEVRIQLINKMTEFVKKELDHERGYLLKLKNVEKYLEEFLNKNYSFNNFGKNETDFLHYTTLDKTYSFLKKNQEYINLKTDALANQDKLIYALDIYDKKVVQYNDYRSKKIVLLISKMFHFPKYDCYNK